MKTKWQIGDTSRKYESGNSGPGTISSGKGDYGGKSYGTYQFSSKMGVVDEFINQFGYEKEFGGLKVGTREFDLKWKQLASDDKFGEDQHKYILNRYYQPQIDFLKKKGIDLSKKGPAVQDAVWSTSVQFGGGTSLIAKSLSGKNVDKMSDADIVSAIQDYKIANNAALFKSSSPAVRESTLKRAKNEKADLIKLARTETVEDNSLIGSIAAIFDAISTRGNS